MKRNKIVATPMDEAADVGLTTAGAAWMHEVENLLYVDPGSASIELSRSSDEKVGVLLRARLIHRTGRGPVRVGGFGQSCLEALEDLKRAVRFENARAAVRDESKARAEVRSEALARAKAKTS